MALLRRLIDGLTTVLNVTGTLGIVALMLLINADVIGRTALNQPLSGVPEMVSLSIVAIVFLQVAQAYRMHRLTRSEALSGWLRRRAPWLAELLELIFALICLGLTSVLLTASWPLFEKAYQRGTYVGTLGDFIAPVWPVKLILLLGCAVLLLQIALRAVEHGQNLISGRVTGAGPVAKQ